MNHYLGVDPGGAFALLDHDLNIKWLHDSPTDEDKLIDLAFSVCMPPNTIAAIECVWAMSRGRKACFLLGGNYWAWKAICVARGLKVKTPTPRKWQDTFYKPRKLDRGLGKKRSVVVCRELYPDVDYFKRWQDHNRADAVLIARWLHDGN